MKEFKDWNRVKTETDFRANRAFFKEGEISEKNFSQLKKELRNLLRL